MAHRGPAVPRSRYTVRPKVLTRQRGDRRGLADPAVPSTPPTPPNATHSLCSQWTRQHSLKIRFKLESHLETKSQESSCYRGEGFI